ncbi:hypothetical protein GBAR_LOCUS427 [Geodia barretti]|uniref:Uncharacterized protein n=1 Tax=Geodia barretti TaxID=519541 RepID=A0AA35QSC1_GEOBA|nr:hypothetical protein GBAR_LOCUS427 [Geodia barretti]
MENTSGSPEIVSASPQTALPEHCVRLTEEQYETLCSLRNDPFFKKVLLTPSYTSWETLQASKEPRNQCLVWRVHHYWLGSLKFALLSKSVGGAEKLYHSIFTIYEELLSNFENDAKLLFPPRSRRLIFDHVGDGVFRLRLAGFEVGKPPSGVGKSPVVTEEEWRRKFCRDPTVGLPLTRLEGDGVEFSPKGLDESSIGPESAAYRHELRRTVAYVAEQMEGRGDRVDWDYVFTGAIAEDHPKNLLTSLSRSLDDFIEDHLQ